MNLILLHRISIVYHPFFSKQVGATAPTSTSLLLIGSVLNYNEEEKFMSEFIPSGPGSMSNTLMQILGSQFALSCTDQVSQWWGWELVPDV